MSPVSRRGHEVAGEEQARCGLPADQRLLSRCRHGREIEDRMVWLVQDELDRARPRCAGELEVHTLLRGRV